MKELFRRCGINPQTSLLTQILLTTSYNAQHQSSLVYISPGQKLQFQTSTLYHYLILNGVMQNNHKTLSASDLINSRECNTTVRAVTNTVLMRLDSQMAQQYIEDLVLLNRELNMILRDVLKIEEAKEVQDIKVVRFGQFQKIYLEGIRGNYVYILLDGIVSVSKKVEYGDCCKPVETYINTNFKYTVLGEQSIYNLPYHFTAKADSKLSYLIQIQTKNLCRIFSVQIYLDLKFKHMKRMTAISEIQEEVKNTNILPTNREKNDVEQTNISLRGLSQKSKVLKGNMSLRSFKPREDYSYLQAHDISLNKVEQINIDYFFDDRKDKVKFELIAKGLVNIEPQNYLKSLPNSGNVTMRVNQKLHRCKRETGKEYLLPIMKKIELQRARVHKKKQK